MRTLIVLSHPDPNSLTHAVAARIADAAHKADPAHEVEIADISAEGFDPRWRAADVAAFRKEAAPPADVLAEQARIDRAGTLVLVFPIYWWAMPGQLKGWIDRVFTNGWAYDEEPGGKLVKKLGHLAVHLVGIGGANMGTYDRHGYATAMKTQIDHGIFGYCGAPVVTSELLLPSDREAPSSHIHKARALGQNLFSRKE